MMQFPTIVYRSPGANPGPNGTSYDYKGVEDAKALEAAIGEGWHVSLVAAVVPVAVADVPEDDDAPPSRDELEVQAVKLGLKFDGRTSDAKLARMINEAM